MALMGAVLVLLSSSWHSYSKIPALMSSLLALVSKVKV